MKDSSERLERIANLTSATVAMIFAVSIPAGYFALSYLHAHQTLTAQAEITAHTLSELIYRQPDMWQFQEHRLEHTLRSTDWSRDTARYAVSDTNADPVYSYGAQVLWPYVSVKANLQDGAKRVGRLEVRASAQPLIHTTLLVSVIGAAAAWLIHYLLKVLPFARLRQVVDSLAQTQTALEKENQAKQQALNEATALSERMHYEAYHDTLTGLPNRRHFQRTIVDALAGADGTHHQAVLLMDLNRFKDVNDTLGHQAGDELLKAVAQRIRENTPDDVVLARLGGDEFAAFAQVRKARSADVIARGITQALHSHIDVQGYHIAMQASIGIATFPHDGNSAESLLRNADIAMYQAKAAGLPVKRYDASDETDSPNRLALTADLRHALDNDELSLYFQPKIDLTRNEIVGAEALCRWQHPKHGFVSPDLFIPIAEQSGMIRDLSQWVFRSAFRQIAAWQRQHISIELSVNVSANNLLDESLPAFVDQLARDFSVQPETIQFEITESAIMTDPGKAEQVIKRLSDWGASVAIDDFGTGYSSLAYIKRLAVDELKVDKSFILNLLDSADDQIIVRSTIELAHNLGMTVVAEGIENVETAEMLRRYGCEIGQGYYYCRPLPPEVLTHYLLANASLAHSTLSA